MDHTPNHFRTLLWAAGAAAAALSFAWRANATERYCAGTCHEDLQALPHQHTALDMGDCTDCHQPTVSASAKCDSGNVFTILAVPELCFDCHDDPANGGKLHGFDKSCTECHNPHGGADEKNMQRGSIVAQCSSCHELPATGATVHPPVADGQCTRCHDPHDASAPKRLRKPLGELCFSCHDKAKVLGDLPAGATIHGPVAASECTACHDPHRADNSHLLRAQGNDLCLMCHGVDSSSEYAAQVRVQLDSGDGLNIHDAVSDGDCTDCHAVHASKFAKLLTSERPQLCFDCHDAFEEPIPHSAVRLGRCNGCHEPHGSRHQTLLEHEGAQICFECHSDDVTGRPTVHQPVAEGKCLGCHAPHGGERPYMLLEGGKSELCLGCHGPEGESKLKIDLSLATVHGAITRFGCTRCHDPHGGNNELLLIQKPNALCTKCHAREADGRHAFTGFDGRPHVVEGKADPARPGQPMSCISCHSPHASASPKLWREGRSKMELCARCHDKVKPGSQARWQQPPVPAKGAGPGRAVISAPGKASHTAPAEQ